MGLVIVADCGRLGPLPRLYFWRMLVVDGSTLQFRNVHLLVGMGLTMSLTMSLGASSWYSFRSSTDRYYAGETERDNPEEIQ